MSRPEAGLEEIRNAFDRAVYGAERRAWIIGLLGMQNIDETVTIHVPDRLGFVFVRTGPSGQQLVTIARNDGKVPIRAGMPVRMKRADDGTLVIYGVFNAGGFTDSGMSGDYENNFGLEWHHHRIGSGLEFEFEGLMHERGRARPTTGMLAYMNAFRYYHGGVWKVWEGGTIDLTDYKPSGSGVHAWVIIGVNPEDGSATATTGPAISTATALTYADANDVPFLGIPVAAVKVRDDSNSILDMSLFIDVHEWFAGLHYSELGDLVNVNTKDGYYGIGPYWNDELYYHGYDGYGFMSGGHRQNFGTPKIFEMLADTINIGDFPSFGMIDIRGESNVDDDLVNINGGKVGDMIVIYNRFPGSFIITIKNTGNINIPADMILDAASKVAILVLTDNGWMQSASVPSTLYDYIDFDVTYADGVAEGRLQWNIEDGTLEVGLPGGTVNLQLGQEMVIRCRNTTGVTIANGSIVEIIGASGNKPLISLADASDLTKVSVIGMATEDILHNGNGYITSVGFVREINTNGMTIGEPVWLSEITPGAFTQTRPTAPDFSFAIGIVVAAHTTEGVLYVGGLPYLPLMSASDVLYDATPADGEFLVWNGSNGRFELSSVAVAHALTDHTDVTITTPAENDTLHYDGAGWINKVGHRLNMQDRVVLTISSGAIDITGNDTEGYFDIRGEGSVDDTLSIITGGNVGDIIHLSTYAATTYGDITVNNNNNIQVPSTDVVLNSQSDGLTLIYTTWGWFPITVDKRLDGATVDVPASLQVYIDKKERLAQENMFGGLATLATAQPLDSVPTNLVVTAGIGKLLVAVNAGSDTSGSILVTGTSVDRDTGAETPADTDTLTIAGVTTDGSSTDGNGNVTHSFSTLYITSKWFRGTVTLSTADLTLTDVDVYQAAFYQFGDYDDITLDYLDVTALPTNGSAWMDVHLYSLEITGTDQCSITKEATLEELTAGITANVPYRKRKGALAKALDGSTDGIWVETFLGPLANTYWDDITLIVGYTHQLSITPGV